MYLKSLNVVVVFLQPIFIDTNLTESIFSGRTHGAPFRGYGYVPLRNGGNVVTRIGTQQQQQRKAYLFLLICFYSTDKKGEKLYTMLF